LAQISGTNAAKKIAQPRDIKRTETNPRAPSEHQHLCAPRLLSRNSLERIAIPIIVRRRNDMSQTVIIRTSDNEGGNVINVTLEVEEGEILIMCGEDEHGHIWDVERIKFNFLDQERALTADRCCQKVGAATQCFEC